MPLINLKAWLDPLLNPLACLPEPPSQSLRVEDPEHLLKRLEAMLQNQLRYALAGEKRSILRGQGLDFADLREYVPGDDIRKIDWNVFARTLMPHVREYHEDKQLTLWLAVDATASMQFGRIRSKLETAVELAGLFALLAHRANHKLGGFVIRANEPVILPPKAGYAHVQQLMKNLLDCLHREPETAVSPDPLPAACQQLGRLVQKNATVIMLSDFLSFNDAWHVPLGQLSRQARMIYLMLGDPTEAQLPAGLGLLDCIDPETGRIVQLDTHDKKLLRQYEESVREMRRQTQVRLQDTGRLAEGTTEEGVMDILARLLGGRSAA